MAPGAATLGEARVQELQAASRVLGIADVVLLEYEDGMLPWVDAERLEADLRDTIRRLRPDVVITFGEDGLYGHPDHIAIHERTTAAVAALGKDTPALYYVTMPAGSMRAVIRHAEETLATKRGAGGQSQHRILGIADPDAFGALAPPPTLVVDVSRFAARKLAAIKCHRTQLEHDALALLADSDAARLLGTEHFHRASVGARGHAFIERFASTLCGVVRQRSRDITAGGELELVEPRTSDSPVDRLRANGHVLKRQTHHTSERPSGRRSTRRP